jgi:hypothetical protein
MEVSSIAQYNASMEHIGSHIKKPLKKSRETERGELMRHFCNRLNRTRLRDGFQKITMAHMGKILEKIPTKDLYYLKTVCDSATDFSKRFWWELNPDMHTRAAYERAMRQFKKK